MRASDSDRERAVDVLRIAAGDGRLTAEELDERLEAALSARTLGELAGVISDLPGRPDPAAEQAKDVLRIDQRGGSVQLTGRWMVPRRLELRSSWCDVTLDFTDAVITHDTLPVDINVRGGSLILVAGPGIAVEADELTVRYTDVDIGRATGHDARVILRVRLAGRMRYGRIETRWPRPAAGP
jgi:hypothetical protein